MSRKTYIITVIPVDDLSVKEDYQFYGFNCPTSLQVWTLLKSLIYEVKVSERDYSYEPDFNEILGVYVIFEDVTPELPFD